MSYLTPAIGMRLARIRRDVEDSWESWGRWLDTADREHVKDAAEVLYGLDARVKSLLIELDYEAEWDREEEGES